MNSALGKVLLQYTVLHVVCKDASQANYLYILAPAPIPGAVAWGTSAWPCVHSPVQLCCPEVAPELGPLRTLIPGWLQDNAEPVSYFISQGNFAPLQGVLLPLAFLLPASLTPSCSWAFLPSVPDHSSVTNYDC